MKNTKTYYIVPSKNKVTGELLDIKIFTSMDEASIYSEENFKENVGVGKFIEKPILGTWANSAEEALRTVKSMFPEHCVDSQDTIKNINEAYLEEISSRNLNSGEDKIDEKKKKNERFNN